MGNDFPRLGGVPDTAGHTEDRGHPARPSGTVVVSANNLPMGHFTSTLWPGGTAWPGSYRNSPTQKLKIWVRSSGPLTIGKPKSSAIGTGPSAGTMIRAPTPADTR